MIPSSRQRDRLLERLVLEERSPLEAFDRSRLAGDLEARAELEGLLETRRRVDELVRDDLAAMDRPGGDAEARVLDRVREQLEAEAPARTPRAAAHRPLRPSTAGWIAACLAAGLLLLAGWRLLMVEAPGPDPDTHLGGGARLEILSPVGSEGSLGQIVWSGARPLHGRFVVRVLSGDGHEQIAISPALEENRWLPPADEWSRWPETVRLRVEVRGESPAELVGVSPEVLARPSR